MDFVQIESGSYAEIEVKENWFATTIAISYLCENYRYITAANKLSADGSMAVSNSRILYS